MDFSKTVIDEIVIPLNYQEEEKMDEDSLMRWMHVFNDEFDMLYFGFGQIKSVDAVCAEIRQSKELMKLAEELVQSSTRDFIAAGHSEGSGWAICFNELLEEKEFPKEHYAIVTGALTASPNFMQKMDPYTKFHTLSLMAQTRLYDQTLLPDIMTLFSSHYGCTFPSYGFTCDETFQCVKANDPIDIAAGLTVATKIVSESLMNYRILRNTHTFTNYKNCFQSCKEQFPDNQMFNFQANTLSYVKRMEPSPAQREQERVPGLEIMGCRFC